LTGRSRESEPAAAPASAGVVFVLVLTLLLAVAVASCSDDGASPSSGTSSPAPTDPVAILEDAAANMSTDGLTAHIAFGQQLSIDGPTGSDTFTATGSGDLQMPTAIRYVVEVSAGDEGGALEVLTLDGVTYYTRDANDPAVPFTQSDSPMTVPFDLGAEITRYLAMSTKAEVVKTFEEDGQTMTVVRVTLDPLEYAHGREQLDMARVVQQTFGLTAGQSEKALAKGKAFAEFAVGQDDRYVHDLTERWLVRLDGGKGFLQEVVLSFSRFGKPIDPPIEKPET
jgi:hypothetical protein